jgi:hypothetical protein
MKLSIFGSSEIISHHINAANKNSFKIFSICTLNKKSKNVKILAKKFKIKNIFTNLRSFIKNSRNNNCFVLISGRIRDNDKVLNECIKNNLKIIIEKPVFTELKKYNKYLKFKKNIFVGYNRIYYSNILQLKKMIALEKPLNVMVKCPEESKKHILTNSSHIISILYFLFGNLKKTKKIKKNNFILCMFKTNKNIPIFLNFSFNSPENFSIELNFKNKKIILKPIEKLFIYKELKKVKYKNTNIFLPKVKKVINEYDVSNLKPGFDEQYKNFRKFLKNKKYYGIKINDAKKIMSICKQIIK